MDGYDELKEKVDTLITIPNDRILSIIDKKTPLLAEFIPSRYAYEALIVEQFSENKYNSYFFLEDKNILFSGDHILKHITPNAFVMLDDNQILPERKSQREYFASISKIERINPLTLYPAHGDRITDLDKTIGMYRRCFKERENKIIQILQTGIQSVYKIARKLFPNIGGERLPLDINLAVSEVFTHLQVLQEKNLVSFRIETTLKVIYQGG